MTQPRRTLRLFEAAWLLQETANATRRLCRLGLLPYSQHGKFIQIPVAGLRERLQSTRALRRLDELVAGSIKAPRTAKASDPARPLTETAP